MLAELEDLERQLDRGEFSAEALCHPAQRRFVRSRAKRKVARCGRRSGKTTGIAVDLLEGALEPPFGNQLYVTMSLKNARRLVWPTLRKLNQHFELGGVVNETEAFMHFPRLPNDPHIFLGGANDAAEIDKLRGYEGGLKRAVLDEAQSIRQSLVGTLIDDVIEPALMDYDGQLVVVGTPGPVCAGYFYDLDVGERRGAWEHHAWTAFDNPFLAAKSGKSVEELLSKLRADRNWTEQTPTYRREYLGLWVTDIASLVYRYDRDRNHCDWQDGPQPGWTYVLGLDLGFDDSDAIVLLGWPKHSRVVHLVYEDVAPKQTLTPLFEKVTALWQRWRPIGGVGDTGGLGRKIVEELQARFKVPVEAAEKTRKAEHVELLNDAMVTGAFMAPRDSRFADDTQRLQWDPEAKAKGVLKESDKFHSDVTDAALYAYRRCRHYLEQDAPKPSDPIDEMRAKRLKSITARKRNWWE